MRRGKLHDTHTNLYELMSSLFGSIYRILVYFQAVASSRGDASAESEPEVLPDEIVKGVFIL
eukprot:scaffold93648_cov21-Prasinocladus_malaysianus.AAC.1